MLSYYDIKNIIRGSNSVVSPVDDFRIVDSYAIYKESGSSKVSQKPLEYLCYEIESVNPETGEVLHFFKALKFCRIIRLPKSAKQSTSFMDIQRQILTSVYQGGYNMVTVIANIIKPTPLGLLFLYGVQGVASTIEEAKEQVNQDFIGLTRALQGSFRVLEMRIINAEETEWLRDKMYNMDFMTVMKGIPKANTSGEDLGNKGMGGKNLNPDSQGTLEEFIAGMADYEYVVQVLSTPVFRQTLQEWSLQTEKQMTNWNSQLQGTKALSFSISMPMMYMANQSNSEGWSKAYTDADSVSFSEGNSFSNSYSESVGQSLSESFSESYGVSHGQSVTNTVSQSTSVSNGMTFGRSSGISVGQSIGQSVGENVGMSSSIGSSMNISEGESISHSTGQSVGESFGTSQGESYSQSFGQSVGSSHSVGTSQSVGTSESVSMSQGTSASFGQSVSQSQSNSSSSGWSASYGQNSSVSNSSSSSYNHSENSGWNTGANTSVSNGENSSMTGSVGIGAFGASGNVSTSGGQSYTESSGMSSGQSGGVSDSYGYSSSSSSSHGNSFTQGQSGSVSSSYGVTSGASVSQGVSSSISQGASVSQSFGASESFGTSASQSASESFGLSQSTSQSQNVSNNVSDGWGSSISKSQGVSESLGYSQGQSLSSNLSNSASQNISQSQSVSQTVSNSVSVGKSVGESVSESVTQGKSQGTSESYGQSQGVSQGVSQTSGTSKSSSLSTGSSGAYVSGSSSSMGLGPSIGYNKSYQWLDQQVKDILELLEYQNERIKRSLRGEGAFYTYVYIACPTKDALAAAAAVAKSTWQNEYAMVNPLQVLKLSEEEQKHLLYHFAAFSADVTREKVGMAMQYKYSTILLPQEYVAYTHLPRISEGGIFADVNDIPKFAVPSQLKGEIFLGSILSAERYTMLNGYKTPFDYRIDESELMHGYFTAGSRAGKTVAAMRFVAELANVKRKKTGKRLRIVCMDPKQDWRTLARFIDPERFRFYSLGNCSFRPVKINPFKIPRGVVPQTWIDGVIDIYCRAYGLLERGKQMMGETIYALYEEAGVFEACDRPDWQDIVPDLSREVTFEKVYKKMESIKASLEDPTGKKGRAGNDTRDAYARLLDRLQCFSRKFSVEFKLFGTSEGIGIDDMIGDDDVTILESSGLEKTFKNFIFGVITSGFYKYAKAHEGGYLAENQYETVLVIEEANEVLLGNDAAGSSGGSSMTVSGQSEFEEILDQSAGYGLFIIAITQKISDMPKSVIANAGLVFAGRLKIQDDITTVIRSVAREERFDDRDLVKWFPRMATGMFVCQRSRVFDIKDAEPILVMIAPLNAVPPSNLEVDEILSHQDALKTLKRAS